MEHHVLDTRVLPHRFLAFCLDLALILWGGHLLGVWNPLSGLGFAEGVAVFLLYRTICEAYPGRTFSKMIFRIRVVRRDDIRTGVGLWKALLRNLMVPADHVLITSIVGLIVPVGSEGNRRVGDFLAGTMVVSEASLARSLGRPGHQRSYRRRPARPSKDERARRLAGDRGEAAVARELEKLARHGRFYVFNKLPERRVGDVDHLVVGPCGLVIVETKANGGAVQIVGGRTLVNGRELHREPISQARRQREALYTRLGQFAAPTPYGTSIKSILDHRGLSWLVCFPNARNITAAFAEQDRWLAGQVKGLRGLRSRITDLEEVLIDEEIDGLAAGVAAAYNVQPDASPRTLNPAR